jgi:hypothetical protein
MYGIFREKLRCYEKEVWEVRELDLRREIVL